jgi:heavy metal sensor kinase
MNKVLMRNLPIQARLTLLYVLLLGLTFSLLGVSLIIRFKNSLLEGTDRALQINVNRTIASLDLEDLKELGKLSFDIVQKSKIQSSGFAMQVVSPEGDVWDTFGEVQQVTRWGLREAGFSTQSGIAGGDDAWRVLSQPVVDSGDQVIAWVQAAQSVSPVNEAVRDLQEQLLFGIPLVLIFAGAGGHFLATRALQPIRQITHTAQSITAQDLSQRIGYSGPGDEIGDLAKTFDQMIARLQESFERERRFTNDAAHELRTPLAILKGQMDVTLSRPRDTVEYEGKLRELSVQVERLIRLSNALLFLARADRTSSIRASEPVDLREGLTVLLEQVRPLAGLKNISLTENLEKDLVPWGDNDQLIQLFMNMIENALTYTPAGGQISVRGRLHAGYAVIDINNTGSTIPDEHLPHVFERFYRVDTDRSSRSGGNGLGLAIAQEIARVHGGRIEVRSDPVEGVTFSVWLSVSPGGFTHPR